MSVEDRAPAHVKAIAPYQPGKPISDLARELGLDEAGIVKLASNENPLGVNEAALVAMTRALADVTRYPDGNGFEVKAAIGSRFGVDPAQVVLGNGSNDVLELAARAFLLPGTSAVYAQHAPGPGSAYVPTQSMSAGPTTSASALTACSEKA